jgi:translation initiation factor IF-3
LNEAKKKQAQVQLKEVQFRPNIESHDLETKLKRVYKFLDQSDKVKMVMQFRGREMAYRDAGLEKFNGIVQTVCDYGAVVESRPKMMGNRVIGIVAPDKKILEKRKKERESEKPAEAAEASAEE